MSTSKYLARKTRVLKQLNWRAILVRILVTALTLFITVGLTPTMHFVDPTIGDLIILVLVLGLLNAIIKPIIQFFTLSYIFVTYGLVVILINTLLLYMLSWLFPTSLAIENPFWALWGGALMGVVGGFLESLFGLTLPIVDPDVISEPMRQAMRMQQQSLKKITPEAAMEPQGEPTPLEHLLNANQDIIPPTSAATSTLSPTMGNEVSIDSEAPPPLAESSEPATTSPTPSSQPEATAPPPAAEDVDPAPEAPTPEASEPSSATRPSDAPTPQPEPSPDQSPETPAATPADQHPSTEPSPDPNPSASPADTPTSASQERGDA